jgi:hypothetical protein
VISCTVVVTGGAEAGGILIGGLAREGAGVITGEAFVNEKGGASRLGERETKRGRNECGESRESAQKCGGHHGGEHEILSG